MAWYSHYYIAPIKKEFKNIFNLLLLRNWKHYKSYVNFYFYEKIYWRVIVRFDTQDINFFYTPMEKNLKISSSVGNTLENETKYMTH